MNRSPVILGLLLMQLALTGCESLAPRSKGPTLNTTPVSSGIANEYLRLLAELSGADRARQSDVFYEVERAHVQSPTTLTALRYALALGIPGHANSNISQSKKLLEQLLAAPERLTSDEKALAGIVLNIDEQWLKQEADSRRLAATVDDKSRAQSNAERRLQTQTEELNRLRKALDAAQQKLDAIKDLEKSISERSTSTAGSRDPGNRDNTNQTQTAPAGR